MKTILLISVLAAWPAAVAAQEAPVTENAELKEYYDKAFTYYVDGDYASAIEHWNMVLRSDPKQTTARNMIEEARKKMAGSAVELKGSFMRLVGRGRYSEALIKLEELLATDPTNPYYLRAQGRLRKIAAASSTRRSSRAWNAAAEGISSWVGEDEDLPFAYDALRYASELGDRDRTFPKLVTALESESPQLKLNDTKPANIPILEHKKEKALHQIYDSKFYLAVKELEGVLRLEPDDITALKRIGSAYLQMKDYRRARSAWQKALKLAPEDDQLPQYLEALDKVAEDAGKKG